MLTGLLVGSALWVFAAVRALQDAGPSRAERARARVHLVPPEWSPTALVGLSLGLVGGWWVWLDSRGWSPLPQEWIGAWLVAMLVYVVVPLSSMVLFTRPRFLVPRWRREELDGERRARRGARRQRT